MKAIARTVTALLMVTSMGCAEQEVQVLLAQAVLQPNPDCTVTALLGSKIDVQDFGLLDLSLARDGYYAAVQTVSGLSRSQEVTGLGPAQAHLENGIIRIIGATIEYQYAGGVTLPSGFFVHSAYALFPEEAGVSFINILPPQVLNVLKTDPHFSGDKALDDPMLAACYDRTFGGGWKWKGLPLGGREAEIIVKITMEGRLSDGVEVLSNTLFFPIRICVGCLTSPSGSFSGIIADEAFGTRQLPCVVGQDTAQPPRICVSQEYFIEQDIDEKLAECALDPNFPPPGTPAFSPCAVIPPYSQTEPPTARYANLRLRYGCERVEKFCLNLRREAPLWPEQGWP